MANSRSFNGTNSVADAVADAVIRMSNPYTVGADMPDSSVRKILVNLAKAELVFERELGDSRPLVMIRDLTRREKQIVGAISHGLLNKQIAEIYGLSEETIKSHVRRSLYKLEAKNRTHLVSIALREGIIH